MTACPCAQNIMKERAMRVLEGLDVNKEKIDEFIKEVDAISDYWEMVERNN